MKKYNYVGWCMAGSLGLSAMSGQAAQPEKKQPHIILIMTDQQRWDALGCAGNEAVISPNVDRLAADGHLFCFQLPHSLFSLTINKLNVRMVQSCHMIT